MISKDKALSLIDEKISQFKKLIEPNNIDDKLKKHNLHDNEYYTTYNSTISLLTDLLSAETAEEFELKAQVWDSPCETGAYQQLQSYRTHIDQCISLLGIYRDKIENFWGNEDEKKMRTEVVPFVSMSFDPSDESINNYITGILDALQIDYKTGERYSKESIPEKVKTRIKNSNLFIGIFVKRDEITRGGYAAPAWLIKELGIASGAGKEIIAWVEEDINDIAGLNYEKEVIYFEREKLIAMERATIKFLEALREHNLI